MLWVGPDRAGALTSREASLVGKALGPFDLLVALAALLSSTSPSSTSDACGARAEPLPGLNGGAVGRREELAVDACFSSLSGFACVPSAADGA